MYNLRTGSIRSNSPRDSAQHLGGVKSSSRDVSKDEVWHDNSRSGADRQRAGFIKRDPRWHRGKPRLPHLRVTVPLIFFSSSIAQSHICVLQTTLDLLERGCDVHVLADGVSSCNKEEVPIALARMKQAGAQITTSESMLYQLMGTRSRRARQGEEALTSYFLAFLFDGPSGRLPQPDHKCFTLIFW